MDVSLSLRRIWWRCFLIPYILFSILFGLVGLSAEFAIGRRAKTGTLGAYEYCWSKIKQSKLGYCLGWIPLLGSLGIAIGYAIIIGWVLRALWWSITGEMLSGHHEVFLQEVTGEFGSVFWHTRYCNDSFNFNVWFYIRN